MFLDLWCRWALGVEGRQTESKAVGRRLTKYSARRIADGVTAPLLPPERYLAQEALHLSAFADWEAVLALDAPPEEADFVVAVYHYARRCGAREAAQGLPLACEILGLHLVVSCSEHRMCCMISHRHSFPPPPPSGSPVLICRQPCVRRCPRLGQLRARARPRNRRRAEDGKANGLLRRLPGEILRTRWYIHILINVCF